MLEQEAEKKLKELKERQAVKEEQRRAVYEEMREQEEARRLGEREARQQRQRQLQVEQRKLADEQKVSGLHTAGNPSIHLYSIHVFLLPPSTHASSV